MGVSEYGQGYRVDHTLDELDGSRDWVLVELFFCKASRHDVPFVLGLHWKPLKPELALQSVNDIRCAVDRRQHLVSGGLLVA